MKQYTADFRDFAKADPSKIKWPTSFSIPPLKRGLSADERKPLRSALAVGGSANPAFANCGEVLDVCDSPPTVNILAPVTTKAGIAFSKSTDLTVSIGLNFSEYAVVLGTATGGVWGSTTREAGVFYTIGYGVTTSVGVSWGSEYTFIFGAPADFRGPYYAVGAGVSGSVAGVTGMVLFSPGPPLTLMGYSLTVGQSTPFPIPFSATFEWTNTTAPCLLKF